MKIVRNTVRDKGKTREAARTVTLDSSEIIGLVERAIGGDIEASVNSTAPIWNQSTGTFSITLRIR